MKRFRKGSHEPTRLLRYAGKFTPATPAWTPYGFRNPAPESPPLPDAIDLLLTRRVRFGQVHDRAWPSKKQLDQILLAAARAPDHGKLFPWRFIVLEGKGRKRAGDILAEVMKAEHEKKKTVESERERFLRAPVVVAVVSRTLENIKIPEWEQVLSAGAVCQNMLIASHALGFVANWLTEWDRLSPGGEGKLGLKPGERIAGYIYIGTPGEPLEERVRPEWQRSSRGFRMHSGVHLAVERLSMAGSKHGYGS